MLRWRYVFRHCSPDPLDRVAHLFADALMRADGAPLPPAIGLPAPAM
jgi:hypothetical protein